MSSDPISSTSSATNSASQTAATATTSPTGIDPIKNSKSTEGFDPKATYSSFSEFQQKAPQKVRDGFMSAIAETIIRDMKKGGERVKKAWKKIREN